MSVELDINKHDINNAMAALKRAGANMEKMFPRIISDATTLTFRAVKSIASEEGIKQTGLYQKSWRMRTEGSGVNTEGFVGNAARDPRTGFPYPKVIEFGSKAHVITPNTAKALHFFTKGGAEVFTKKVMHPGTKPRHVLKRAKERVLKQLDKLVEKIIRTRRR